MVHFVIMVAGMSSRFGGIPKQMARVGPNNETLIEYSVDQALKNSEISKIVFITNVTTEKLFVDIFGSMYKGIPVVYVQQTYDKGTRIKPWGTADAVACLHGVVDEPFILINGDDIYGESSFKVGLENMAAHKGTNIVGGLKLLDTLPECGAVNRGVIYLGNENTVVDMREKYAISRQNNPELFNEIANVNFFCFTTEILALVHNKVMDFKKAYAKDPKIECVLTNLLGDLLMTNKITMRFFQITEEILGITNVGDDLILREKIANKKKL
jgi:choline kinase